MFVKVTVCMPVAVIVPEDRVCVPVVVWVSVMVTARPAVLKLTFSVSVPCPLPATVIGVVNEGVMLKVTGRVDSEGTLIKADGA